MRFTILRALALTTATISVAACQPAVQGGGPSYNASDVSIRAEVNQQLAQSSAEAANALKTLAMIQRTRSAPVASAIDDSGLPPELLRPTTLEWSGPAREAVKELAANIGYSFIESGAPPQKPVLVSVNIKDVSAAKAFENIGLQVQAFATVIVDPNKKRVEFRSENAGQRGPSAPPLRRSPPLRRVTK